MEATSGGTCKPFVGTLDAGIDRQYVCTMTRGTHLTLSAEAIGPSSQMDLACTVQADATVTSDDDLDVSVVGSDVVFARSGTGTVTCTADTGVTLAVSIDGAVEHTTKLTIDCVPPVQITNYSPGTSRTVAAATTATGWFDVEISCEATAAGYADAAATARFWAYDDAVCVTDLGTLSHGLRTESGTIAQDIRCKSYRRDTAQPERSYYARRHTFTMATSGWVSLDLEAVGSGPHGLDVYLLLLYRHGSGGTERARDDNSGTSANAQLADLFLAAGTYTIEATTATAGATGGYRLSIDADFAARAPDQPARTLATVGQQITRTWNYLPAAATATVQSVTPEGLAASIISDNGFSTLTATATHAGDYTVTVAYTASGHTHTKTTVIDADCPPRHVQTHTRTCTPLATALPTVCTVTALHDGRIWGRRQESGTFNLYGTDAPAACTALSHDGRASYYSFTLPDRLPVRLRLKAGNGGPLYLMTAGGAPSLTIWEVLSTHPATGREVGFKGTSPSTRRSEPLVDRTLSAGTYLIEIAPSTTVSTRGQFVLTTELPTAERTHADVQNVGNTGLDGAGMTLGQFLDARGNLIYGAHPGADPSRATDPFYPESPNYPWLPFTADRCSIPFGTTPVIEQIYKFYNFEDYPSFNGVAVPFIYGCMRHDFNWRNLYRLEQDLGYDDGHPSGFWRRETMREANGRLGEDLYFLCNIDATAEAPHPDSPHFDWRVPRTIGTEQIFVKRCERKADQIKWAVGLAELHFSGIRYKTE